MLKFAWMGGLNGCTRLGRWETFGYLGQRGRDESWASEDRAMLRCEVCHGLRQICVASLDEGLNR